MIQLGLSHGAKLPSRRLLCKSLRAKRRTEGDEGGARDGYDRGNAFVGAREEREEAGAQKRVLSDRSLVACAAGLISLMYISTALLFHLPSSFISSFDIPLAVAVTAAPFRKECPE